ncbi:hypothetical protein ACOSQ2_014966 [Xanthoceras sorbifolium]
MGLSNSSSWEGFGAKRDMLKIYEGGITISKDQEGTESALILKVIGRAHTLNFMRAKLKMKWNLIDQWQLTNDGFFIVRFQFKDDLEYVLTGGPWFIMNQYLVVQRGKPDFVPGEEAINFMAIWVRLSRLPIEWIDFDLLWRIGRMLGSNYKVDPVTETQARGRFARPSMEIDISKPLLGSLRVDGRTIMAEYENLDLICFKCSFYGHGKEACRDGVVEQQTWETAEKENMAQPNSREGFYGLWLQVFYNRRGADNINGRRPLEMLGI